MKCTACGKPTHVLETSARGGGATVLRRRECLTCGHRFNTDEVPRLELGTRDDTTAIRDLQVYEQADLGRSVAFTAELLNIPESFVIHSLKRRSQQAVQTAASKGKTK